MRPGWSTLYDNAMWESFFGTLECDLLDRYTFRTPTEARQAVFRYIEGWYNPRRRHSSLGYLSPAMFEAKNWPGSERTPDLADFPAVGKHRLAEPGSTPLQAAEALLTPGREEEEIRLTQPQ